VHVVLPSRPWWSSIDWSHYMLEVAIGRRSPGPGSRPRWSWSRCAG